MSAPAVTFAPRRGACPGLSAPMATGDGLLVRMLPAGTMPLAGFADLCAAARAHGNGVVEITSRGSIQVRGLSLLSAPPFAEAVAALGIAADDGTPILTNPLAGLDADELLDPEPLAAALRIAIARRALTARLNAKVSVAIDAGGRLKLDGLAADVRLRAELLNGDVVLGVALGGDGPRAVQLGTVAAADGVEAAARLLDVLARQGADARARDMLAAEGPQIFRSAVAGLLVSEGSFAARQSGEAIGQHMLRDGSFASGIGVAFGHADASALERLSAAAEDAGSRGLRTAPRALLAIGLPQKSVSAFAAAAERLGFIVRAGDPRRHVVACAGAPICASAAMASRAIAPHVAESIARFIDSSSTIHISGCGKSCAHAGAATLTVVGTDAGCAIIANGSTCDAPFAVVPPAELPAALTAILRRGKCEDGHV